ncbi:MAG: CaiB/BaiF CoA transferase family protein, partial [Acidimicrobiales bacterium]
MTVAAALGTLAAMTAPLEGIRILDIGTRIGAPFCAGLLGEMGAEVIKVEQPDGGDFMRTIGPFVDAEDGTPYSLWWAVEGRGRQGVTLDLRQAEGQALFRRLAARADVVCENFRPGTLEGWRIGPEDCDSRLVWARISVFGQDGPYSSRPGLDRMGIAYGGLLAITGYPDRPPVRPGVTISDYLTGVFAAEAVVAALYRRDRPGGTGVGGVIDAPLYGSVLRVLEWTIAAEDRLGLTRQRQGNRLANSAPLDNYPTADGRYVCIVGGSDANFRRLCRAMDRPDLLDDPRWSTLARRAAGADELNDIVAAWTRTLEASAVEAACVAHGVPVGIAYDASEILADPHM